MSRLLSVRFQGCTSIPSLCHARNLTKDFVHGTQVVYRLSYILNSLFSHLPPPLFSFDIGPFSIAQAGLLLCIPASPGFLNLFVSPIPGLQDAAPHLPTGALI